MTACIDADFSKVLLEWLAESPTIPLTDIRKLLRNESAYVRANTSLGMTDSSSLALEGALSEAFTSLQGALDTHALCKAAEHITVSTDLDVLYDLLDPECTLHLSCDSRPVSRYLYTGTDAVIAELCEQQESILAHRASLTCGLAGAATSVSVRGVSEVKSWPLASPCTVGTHVTYYSDEARTRPLFALHTTYSFTLDGRHVYSIARTLQLCDVSMGAEALCSVHYGAPKSADT